MRHLPFVLTLAALMALPGCATAPEVVTVNVPGPTRYVPIPDRLTSPCPIEQPRDTSPIEAVRVAKARAAALADCNRDKAEIRAVQGSAK